jgi:hypothetical protein
LQPTPRSKPPSGASTDEAALHAALANIVEITDYETADEVVILNVKHPARRREHEDS